MGMEDLNKAKSGGGKSGGGKSGGSLLSGLDATSAIAGSVGEVAKAMSDSGDVSTSSHFAGGGSSGNNTLGGTSTNYGVTYAAPAKGVPFWLVAAGICAAVYLFYKK